MSVQLQPCLAGRGKAAKRTAGSTATWPEPVRLSPSLWLHGRVTAEHGVGRRHQAQQHDLCPDLRTPHVLLSQHAHNHCGPAGAHVCACVYGQAACLGTAAALVSDSVLNAHVAVHYWACLLTRCSPTNQAPTGVGRCAGVYMRIPNHVGGGGKEPAQLQLGWGSGFV